MVETRESEASSSEVPLGQLVDQHRGISYGVVQPGAADSSGVPIVRVTDIRNGRIATAEPLRIAPRIEEKHSRTRLRGGELLMTLVGTVGETAVVPPTLKGWNTARAVAVIPVRPEVDARWIQCILSTPAVREYIHARLNTTVQATLNLRDVAALPIYLPPARVRNAVLEIVGALDGKIELNRRMNETLEEMARALFKSWFVDFDPVHAKAAGKKPFGMDDHTLRLFPDTFERSDGETPEGWTKLTLGDVCRTSGGGIQTGPFGSQLHASDYVDDGIPCVMPKDLQGYRVSTADIARVSPEDAARLARHQLTPGDIVYSRRGDVERCALVSIRETGWLCGTGCLLVRPGGDPSLSVYVFHAVTTEYSKEWIVRHAHGATMPNLNTGILAALPMLMPAAPVLTAFSSAVAPMMHRGAAVVTESEMLASIRDTLLPKLLSGELRIKDAEKIVGEAT